MRRVTQYKNIREYAAPFSGWAFLNFVGKEPLGQYNVEPGERLAILCREEEALCARRVKWGWRPHWWTTDNKDRFNAPVDQVAHGTFFQSIWSHRAICPVDGWFEWVDEGNDRRQAYYICRRDGAPSLCTAIGHFACDAREAGHREGFVILTADNLGGMVDAGDRRPVVLRPSLARDWMDLDTHDEDAEQMALLLAEPGNAFEWRRVDGEVDNPNNQGAHLILAAP